MKKSSVFNLSILIIGAIFVASCKNDKLIKRGDTLPVAYKKSMALYQSKDYSKAAEAFNTVIEIGRGTAYGKQAQYFLADSYFKDERYLLASSEFDRYISLYPRAEKRKDAQFKEAYSYYKLSPRYRLDQKYARKAIEKFKLFNSRYPDSDLTQKSSKYITELRAKLAEKIFYAGKLYQRTDSYKAANIYYELTIDKYPESIWAQHALVNEIKTYNDYAGRSVKDKKQGRYLKALSAYEKFIQLFPDGKYRKDAENYVDDTRSALSKLGYKADTERNTASAGNSTK